jgi:hypothetical protein
MPVAYDFGSAEFGDAVREAGHKAFEEALAAGLTVFYIDGDGLDVMEQGDGRRFEIRWLPGAPSGENYEIIRELTAVRTRFPVTPTHGNTSRQAGRFASNAR